MVNQFGSRKIADPIGLDIVLVLLIGSEFCSVICYHASDARLILLHSESRHRLPAYVCENFIRDIDRGVLHDVEALLCLRRGGRERHCV